jgi:hypothetical protein
MADYQGFTFSIGVVGHRNLAADSMESLERSITLQLESLAQKLGQSDAGHLVVSPIPIRLYTAMAEGADRLFARVAMRVLGGRLSVVAVLPFEAADYERDFPESVSEFRDLLSRCDSVYVVPQVPTATRNDRYRDAWEYINAKSNLLFALWDMKPGLDAGTAECLRTRCFSAPKTQMGEPYMAGPAIVIPSTRTQPNANDSQDALVNFLRRNDWIATYSGEVIGHKDATVAHADWLRDYAAVALAVDAKRESGSRSLDAGFDAADSVATNSRNMVNSRLKFLAIGFYVLSTALIFIGNIFPRVPVNLLASALTVLALIAWTTMRGRGLFRLHLYARALAEGMRIQRALNSMGISRRAVDLLRYRSGTVPTTLRELLRSIGSIVPGTPGGYEDCAGWLTEQGHYYTGSALLRQQKFEKREMIRKNVLILGGVIIAVALIAAQGFAWAIGATIPRIAISLAFATVISLVTAGFLMGIHTQQMQLREQGASFDRMRATLMTYRDWMNASEQSPNAMTEKEKADAAQWLLAQAMGEHEEWCLRQSGAVV